MSSLLQHHGGHDGKGGVELLAYLVKKGPEWDHYHGPKSRNPNPYATSFTEDVELDSSGNPHLWHFFRKPAGMLGCWVVFRYNGEEHVPDLSIPIALFKMPRDAEKLSDADSVKHWKS